MTQLTDARKTIKVILPSYPDVTVELYDGLLTGNVTDLQKLDTNDDKGIKTIQFLIKSWSFVDAEGKSLPVILENLKLLPVVDFTALMSAVEETMKETESKKKKN